MKRHFLLLNLFLAFNILSAQEVYRFRCDAPQGLNIESSSATELTLHYSLSEIGIATIDNDEAKGHEIILKGSFGSFAEGMPNLPTENRYIAVPQGATVNVTVKEKNIETLSGIDLLPSAHVQKNTDVGLPKLFKNKDVFSKDANFPEENAVVAQITQIRGLDVALLSVTPFRYNPVRKTLEVIYDMDIEVRFEGGNGQFGEARYRNPDWDGILRDLVINSDMLPEAHYLDRLNAAIENGEEGCEYLIIALDADSILAWADTLKNFRTRQGILTKVVTTTECGGNDPDIIKSYIKNAYDNWAIPPAALMIFGAFQDTMYYEEEYVAKGVGIPAFYLFFKDYDYGGGLIQSFNYYSDNPYADMNDDSIPDMAISRMSGITAKDCKVQIEKLIRYETNPPTDAHYYDRPIITSGFEDNKWFMISSQSVNGFFTNKLEKHPYNFYMWYDGGFDPTPPDSIWSSAYNTDAVVDYFGPDGQNYFPRYLCELDNWRDRNKNDYLVNALNGGSFFTFYRDHSSYDEWCCPYFYYSEVETLRNTVPSFLLSVGCDTGCFVEYVYYYQGAFYPFYESNLISSFCKAEIGALGGIGAVSVTRSIFNDILAWGVIDNFWHNFMPDKGTMTQPQFTRPAYALVAGKLFLNEHAFMPNWWQNYIFDTENVFHYLGETYLSLCTEVPQPIAMNASPFHSNDQWEYSFSAEAGATVCFSKDNEIIQVLHGTGHSQSILLPEMAVGEQFTITATMQNHIRFEQDVTVISANQSYVFVREAIFNDEDANGQLDYGESADLLVRLRNAGRYASEGGEITLSCESPYVTIQQATERYPRIEPAGTVVLYNAFNFQIASDIPDQTVLRFGISFNDGENTHTDFFECVANAPLIQINPEFRPLTSDGEPSTHISTEGQSAITFSVKNLGHSAVHHANAELDIKAPFVTVETPRTMIESLAPQDSLSITYELTTTPNDIPGAWLQTRFSVQYEEHLICLDTIVQYGGVFEGFETDTLNPLCLWNNSGSHPWVYCSEDAYEGQRCMISTATTSINSTLTTRVKNNPGHKCKISFRYKTGAGEAIAFTNSTTGPLSSEEWCYAESVYNGSVTNFRWKFTLTNEDGEQAKIDDLWFPPAHAAIAYAGDDILTCKISAIELLDAYAYDYNSVHWTTDGDGVFENDTIVNAVYIPGRHDTINGNFILTIEAIGEDSFFSSTTVQFVDDIELGSIVGDSVVNKYENQVSQYAVENQDGVNYVWTLEPAEAGYIYSHGNAIDLVWNLHEGDMDAILTVTADNGCDMEPVTKTICLIGTGVSEWQAFDFDLYPNPTDGKVSLVMGESLQGKAVIEVYNLLGERMMHQNASQLHQGETITLDLSKMASGLYIITLRTDSGSCSKKVSVK